MEEEVPLPTPEVDAAAADEAATVEAIKEMTVAAGAHMTLSRPTSPSPPEEEVTRLLEDKSALENAIAT